MSSFKLLDAEGVNGRGPIADITDHGERRVSPAEAVAFGGAVVSIDIRSKDDANPEAWKPSGISFTAATDAPQLLAVSKGDQVSANRSGIAGAAVTVLLS